MYALIGWLNITLLLIMTAPYWLRFLNGHTLHLQGGIYAHAIRLLRLIHKPLGGVILTLALIHGYLALGSFRLHTGTLLWLSIAATASLGLGFFLLKKKAIFVWHKRMVLMSVLLLLVHLLFPSALYYLLR